MRVSVRALLLNERDELVVFRREVAGRGVYRSTPGGKIEPGEDDETALRRELFEELGAVCGELSFRFSAPGTAEFPVTHRFYLTRLVSMDLAARTGTEFGDPAKGSFDVELITCRATETERYRWAPPELGSYLREHADSLPGEVPGA